MLFTQISFLRVFWTKYERFAGVYFCNHAPLSPQFTLESKHIKSVRISSICFSPFRPRRRQRQRRRFTNRSESISTRYYWCVYGHSMYPRCVGVFETTIIINKKKKYIRTSYRSKR